MAFVVEDGTGLSNATSLVDVAFFRAYWIDRAVTFTQEDDVIKSWLVAGTDYINTFRFKYCKLQDTQSCEFPREEFGFPEKVKQACCQYAKRAKDGPLAPDPTVDASGYQVTSYSKKVGPIEKSYGFASGAGAKMMVRRPYPEGDSLLRPFIASGNRVIR